MSIGRLSACMLALLCSFGGTQNAHGNAGKAATAAWIIPASAQATVTKLTPSLARAIGRAWCAADIQKDRIVLTLGKPGTKDADTKLTLVHPSVASPQSVRGREVALEPIPGPATPGQLATLRATLDAEDLGALWVSMKAKPIAQAPPAETEGPKGVNANFTRVVDLIKMGDKEEALTLLTLPETSVDATPFQKLRAAIFLKKLGEIDRAKALVTSSSNPLLKAIEGLVLGQELDPKELLAQWDKMQSEAMDTCQLVHVAESAYILGANARSEELLRGIFAKDSACLRAISVLGDNLLVQDRKDDAIALVQPLIDKHPEQSEFKMLLAQYYRLDGRLDEAVALYEEVVKNGNARDEHVRLLVTMYLQQRAEKRQIERWKGLYEENPKNKVAALMIGIMLHYRDEFTESQEWLLPLEAQFKGNPRYQIYRAMNDFNLGDKPGCRARLDMAAQLPVIDPDVYYCRGEILRDSERDTAIADFKRYLALTNDSPFNLPEKQARVREQVRLLEECKANGTETCEGPWEHPRGGLMRFFTLHPEAPWIGFGLVILLLGSAGFLVHRRRKKKVS